MKNGAARLQYVQNACGKFQNYWLKHLGGVVLHNLGTPIYRKVCKNEVKMALFFVKSFLLPWQWKVHISNMCRMHGWSFRKIGWKLWKELITQTWYFKMRMPDRWTRRQQYFLGGLQRNRWNRRRCGCRLDCLILAAGLFEKWHWMVCINTANACSTSYFSRYVHHILQQYCQSKLIKGLNEPVRI